MNEVKFERIKNKISQIAKIIKIKGRGNKKKRKIKWGRK